eukprot:GDKH01008510.1.p1 GENE.GDKH01008510.1~~GDKH01008510.1.p1  ORF type:complete len:127 (+),score=0.62 GDKH01008510.1:27-407(+)
MGPGGSGEAAERAFDWTGYEDALTFCAGGVCPDKSECLTATYTSVSGRKCRCATGYDLIKFDDGSNFCRTWEDLDTWKSYTEICPKDNCITGAFCGVSAAHGHLCTCEPGLTFSWLSLLKKWKCKA